MCWLIPFCLHWSPYVHVFSQAETKQVTGWVADWKHETHSQVAASISSVDLENAFVFFHLIFLDEDHQRHLGFCIFGMQNVVKTWSDGRVQECLSNRCPSASSSVFCSGASLQGVRISYSCVCGRRNRPPATVVTLLRKRWVTSGHELKGTSTEEELLCCRRTCVALMTVLKRKISLALSFAEQAKTIRPRWSEAKTIEVSHTCDTLL